MLIAADTTALQYGIVGLLVVLFTLSLVFYRLVTRVEFPEASASADEDEDRDVVPTWVTGAAFGLALGCGLIVMLLPYGQTAPHTSSSLGARASVAALVYGMPALSLLYFGRVVIFVLYLSIDDNAFNADAVRLARDTLVSVAFNIAAAAMLYKFWGLNAPDWASDVGNSDYLYFSAVTFSTLGYGDFSPLQPARPYAAFFALLGNLHLGIIVGSVLVALKGR